MELYKKYKKIKDIINNVIIYEFDIGEIISNNIIHFDKNYEIKRKEFKSYIDKIKYEKIVTPLKYMKHCIFNNIVVLAQLKQLGDINVETETKTHYNEPTFTEWEIYQIQCGTYESSRPPSESYMYTEVINKYYRREDRYIFGFIYNKQFDKYFMIHYYYITSLKKDDWGNIKEINLVPEWPYIDVEYFPNYEEMIACILYKNLSSKDSLKNKILFFNNHQKEKFFNIINTL